jgi:hypothetical protein
VADESGAEGTVSIVGVDELDPARGGVSWISADRDGALEGTGRRRVMG